MKEFVLVNLFWVSLIMIGYAVLLFMSREKIFSSRIKEGVSFILRQPVPVVVFAMFVAGFVSVVPMYIAAYTASVSTRVVEVIYIGIVAACMGYIALSMVRSFNRKALEQRVANFRWVSLWPILLLITVMGVDFLLSFMTKAYALLDGDTYYHMTRVVSMLSSGFVIDSGFFSGVPDASYHNNLVYALYATAAKILNLDPMTIWSYSQGIFRLMQWLAIYTLGYTVFRVVMGVVSRKKAVLYSLASVIVSMVIFVYYFYVAVYPSQIANLWFITLFVGCLLLLVKERLIIGGVIVTISSILLGFTHPTYALIASGFLVFWLLVRLVFERHSISKSQLYVYFSAIVILLVSPIVTKLMPSHITDAQSAIGNTEVWTFLGLSMKSLGALVPVALEQWLVLILSLIGLVYIGYVSRRKTRFNVLILSLILFPYFVLYFPPVFTLASHILPVWVLERFVAIDVLRFILPTIGVVALSNLTVLLLRKHTSFLGKAHYSLVQSVSMVIMMVVLALVLAPVNYQSLFKYEADNDYSYEYIDTLRKSIANAVPAGARILSDPLHSYTVPALMPVNVIAVSIGHSTTAADTENRIKCQQEMLSTFRYVDLHYTGVDYILISYNMKDFQNQYNALIGSAYVERIVDDGVYALFRVDKSFTDYSPGDTVTHECLQFTQEERGSSQDKKEAGV